MEFQSNNYLSDLSETLGRGSYGSVYTGYNKNDPNDKVAVKEIKNDLKQDGHFSESAKKEFYALQKVCGHANIVQLLDFHSTQRYIYIIMELCDQGDLEHYVRNKPLGLKEKLDVMKQCASGVRHLHSLVPVVVHRDLKPQNILMKKTPTGDVVKITDFGLAKVMEESEQPYMSTDAGTPKFRAPELFMQGRLQYTSAVDVFALGLVYLVLYNYDGQKCTTFEPYDNPNEPFITYGVKLLHSYNKQEPFPNLLMLKSNDCELTIDIKGLIMKMVNFEYKDRIQMNRVVSELEIIHDKTENRHATSFRELNLKLQQKDTEIENLLSELQTQVMEKDNYIKKLTKEQETLQLQKSELQTEVLEKDSVIKKLSKEKERLQLPSSELQTQVLGKDSVIKKLTKEQEKLQSQKSELQTQVLEKDNTIMKFTKEQDKLQLQKSELQVQLLEKNSVIKKLSKDQERLQLPSSACFDIRPKELISWFKKPLKPSLVVAIDFGTSYSGYAFAYQRKKNEILLNDNWGKEVGAEFYKAPTSVLYDEKGEFNSFGFTSERNYLNMNKDDQSLYFRNFKMQLYGRKTFDPDMEICGEGGILCKKNALGVFADVLCFMKEKALEKIVNHNGSLPDENVAPIRWVVAVPAIWNDSQKIFMREACLKAGIIQKLHSRNLIIALEPECASLYCRELSWHQFTGLHRSDVPNLRKGTVYMVVDLGGCTTHITVYRLTKEQNFEEVIPPSGWNHGGNDVNQEYESLFNRILGQDFQEYLNISRPEILPRMMLDFEKAKRTFDESNMSVHIPLHFGLAECYEEYTGKKIWDLLKGDDIKMSEAGNIVIEGETMKRFFSKIVDGIYVTIYDAVNACPEGSRPSYIYLVGGFAEHQYVQKRIKTLEIICKSPKVLVMIPHEASLCVLKGAVKFGQNDKLIKTPISRLTYALLLQREFIKGTDDEARKFKAGDQDMIEYLKPILQIGESVEEGLIKSEPILMGYEGKDIHIVVYSSEAKIVENPKAGNVKELGSIVIKGNGQRTTTNKQATLQFIFGKTELQLRVINSGKLEIVCNMPYM